MLVFKWGFRVKALGMLTLALTCSILGATASSDSYGQSRSSEDSSVVKESVWHSQRPNIEDRLNPAQLPAEEIEKAIARGLLFADQNPIPSSIQLPTGPRRPHVNCREIRRTIDQERPRSIRGPFFCL